MSTKRRDRLLAAAAGALLLLAAPTVRAGEATADASAKKKVDKFPVGGSLMFTTSLGRGSFNSGPDHQPLVNLDLSLRPTYRVEPGLAGQSHAFAVARRLGLPAVVLERDHDADLRCHVVQQVTVEGLE